MTQSAFTYLLVIGMVISLVAVWSGSRSYHLPDNQQDYQPMQPIAFSHHLHAGQLSIDCHYCHTGAETSRHAGIPSSNVCMNCHSIVSSSWGAVQAESRRIDELKEQASEENRELTEEEMTLSVAESEELRKLFDSLGLDAERQRDPDRLVTPVEWVKVHNLPDYVYFDHRAHVAADIDCQTCHGNVETMERVRQVENLSMGWCVNCHRESNRIGVKGKPVNASTDCTTCHY